MTKVTEDTRTISQRLKDASDPSLYTAGLLATEDLENIHIFTTRLGYTIDFLIDNLRSGVISILNLYDFFNIGYFISILTILLLLYTYLWESYISDLKHKIWRARAMINMIPFTIITANKKLMKALNRAKDI